MAHCEQPKRVGALVKDSSGDRWELKPNGKWSCTIPEERYYQNWDWDRLVEFYSRVEFVAEGDGPIVAPEGFVAKEDVLALLRANDAVRDGGMIYGRTLIDRLDLKPKVKVMVLTVEIPYEGDCEPMGNTWMAGKQLLEKNVMHDIRAGLVAVEIEERDA